MTAVISLKNLVFSAASAALVVLLSVAVRADGAYNVYFGGTSRSLPIYSVAREGKAVSITFDCAWGTDHTDDILQALAQYSVRATFFTVEFWTEKYPEYISKISQAGHEIGTHSKTHSHMSKQGAEEIRAELESSSAAISGVTGKAVELFRAPFGDYDDELINTARGMGLYTIQWDVDSLDWKDLSAAEIVSRVTSRVQSGSIILMHNNGLHTAEAVPVILDTLIARGYTFVPVGELIYRDNFTIDANGRQQSCP